MKQVLVFRVSYGYAPMQHDELWQYQTAGDNRVCFTLCEPCNGQTYRGDYLLPIFEYAIKVNDVEIEPHQHKGCRCKVRWTNQTEVLIERLANELQAA